MLTTFVVNSLGDGAVDPFLTVADGQLTLREAITALREGVSVGDAQYDPMDLLAEADRIEFDPSLAGGTISLVAGELVAGRAGRGALTIDGTGITIDARRASRVMTVDPSDSMAIVGLTLANGDAAGVGQATGDGGGLFVNETGGTLTLGDVEIVNGAAINGGGLFNAGSRVRLFNSTVRNSVADGTNGSGGGIHSADGTLVLGNTLVTENVANRSGGGVEIAGGVAFIAGGEIAGNLAGPDGSASPGNGGGLHTGDGVRLTVDAGRFTGNTAAAEGGGIWLGGGGLVLLRNGTLLSGNTALGDEPQQGGGGLYNTGSRLSIRGGQILDNSAPGDNGSGGGVLSQAALIDLTDTTVARNTAAISGGGVEIAGGTAYFIGSRLGVGSSPMMTGENVAMAGGGLHIGSANSTVVIDAGSVRGNRATRDGGGVWIGEGSRLVLRNNVLLTENTAEGDQLGEGGGAIYNAGGRLDMFTGRLLDNAAPNAAGSGGAVLSEDGLVVLANVTIDDNEAARAGGGIEIVDGTMYLIRNSLGGGVNGIGNRATGAATTPGNGGGLHVSGAATVVVDGGTVRNNDAASEGGGLWNQAGSTMVLRNNVQVTANTARGADADNGGGGLFNNGGRLVVFGGRIANNVATGAAGSGGGIFSTGGSLELANVTIARNSAPRAGGGIEIVDGLAYLASVQLGGPSSTDANQATGGSMAAPGNGGGLHVSGTARVTVDGGTVRNNRAAGQGGGLWNQRNSQMIVRNQAFVSDNAALGEGGGIYNRGGLTVQNAVVRDNAADTAGDGRVPDPSDMTPPISEIFAGGGIFTTLQAFSGITNSTLAGNTVGTGEIANEFAGPGQTVVFS